MQKFQINLGKTLPAFRGEWNENTQYDYNDIVTRYESSYVYQKKGASAGKDPYKQPIYEDEHGDEKLYWGLLAGRGVKGAKWYVGSGTIEPIMLDREEQDNTTYYTIDDIDQSSGSEVSEIAQIGDYYLDVLHGTIYMCVYPGGSDSEGNIGNEAAIWRYSSAFSWLETYKYFFLNTADIETLTDETTQVQYYAIRRYYKNQDNTQSGTNLEVVDLADQTQDNKLDIDSCRFNCYLYGQVGTSEEEISPIEPIQSAGNVSWNNIRELEFNEKEIRVIKDEFLQNIWILVEQFSILQTTSSFTFNNMRVAAETLDWTENATVTTNYVVEDDIKHPLMTFGIPRGKSFTVRKIYDHIPTDQLEDWIFDKYDIVLGKTNDNNITSYHFYYNNGEGLDHPPVWVDMGIFNYTVQLRFENIPLNDSEKWQTTIDSNFPYSYSLELEDITEEMIPYVIFDGETAIKEKFSPTAEILKDASNKVVLRLYAAKKAPLNTVLKTVVCALPPYIDQ